jgi:peptidoglycan hydrolase CwlO-like protein|tara:strand:+ start:569 stop:901 length:333 start_codon:yes stop_codon:yes gene_type:complete
MKKIIIIFLLLSVGLSQVTLTEEESKNITNNIIELQAQVDSLTTDTNLKSEEIDLLNKKVTSLEEELTLTEKKAKLVKPSWYENKWLYFGYGGILSYALISTLNVLDEAF